MQRGIDRGALVERADRGIGRADLGIVAFAAEQREHIAVLLREHLGRFHVIADTGESLEIFADIGAGLLAADPELVGEPEGGNAVDDAEIDRLGAAAHLAGHVFDRHAEHFRRRHGVNVEVLAERLAQLLDARDLGEKPQLDLRIVRRNELHPRRGDKRAADLAAVLGADRDVLQIRLRRRQPSGRGRSQRVIGVHAVRGRIDEAGQRIGIGRFQFRNLPPVQNLLRQLMALLGQLFQHARAGGPLPGLGPRAARQPELAE